MWQDAVLSVGNLALLGLLGAMLLSGDRPCKITCAVFCIVMCGFGAVYWSYGSVLATFLVLAQAVGWFALLFRRREI